MFATSFEQQDKDFRNRKTAYALGTTLFIHGVILLILLFMILTPPDPPYTDSAGGVSVNFGTDETGTGDVQAMTLTPIQADFTPAAPAPSAAAEPEETEDIATQDIEDAPVVESSKEPVPKKQPNKDAIFTPKKNTSTINNTNKNTSNTTTQTQPAPPQPDKNAMFQKGAYGAPNNSKGDGTGAGQGDQGNPNGDPNSKSYLGTGGNGTDGPGGNGIGGNGYSLNGRNKIALPQPSKCNSIGKVVIGIKVDRNGKVVDAKLKRFDSTVFDECNVSNALIAAKKATFSPDSKAPEIQEGTITYIFKVN